ncbi:hypothetical protein SAMN05880545_1123 [Microbacterium sp. RU33B]|nr:hypothetical protein SAMN05880545_1123 [Microbacterium sp. RU33B]
MDAVTTLTPDADEELRELRRRAYGPQSSGLSAAELARLEDLEGRARGAAVQTDPLPAEADAAAPPHPAPPIEPTPGAPSVSDAAVASSSSDPVLPPPRRRRWPLWVAGGAGLAAGIALTLGVTSLGERAPDATQRPIENVPLPDVGSGGALDLESLRTYERWNDVSLWTVDRLDGATCLVMAGGGDDDPAAWYGTMQCSRDGLDPQIDFTVWPGMASMIGVDLPADSSVRFVARRGVIDVWVDAAGEISGS